MRVKDPAIIKAILEHESINMTENLTVNDDIYWLTNQENDCLACAYRYVNDVYMCHIYVKKSARGKKAIQFGKDSIKWWQDNTSAIKLVGFTPSYLKHAYLYALRIGFKKQGFFRDSIKHNGKMYGHYITGVSNG